MSYLRGKGIELIRIKEFLKCHIQTVTDLLDGKKFRIITFPVENVFNTGRRQGTECGQLVDRDVLLPTQLKDSVFYGLGGGHLYTFL